MLCFLFVLWAELSVIVYGKYECFVMQMLYVCVLCASCGSSKCRILHKLQFVVLLVHHSVNCLNIETPPIDQ